MANAQQLREQRANVWTSEMTPLVEAMHERDLTVDERAKFDALEQRMGELDEQIERAETAERRQSQMTTVNRGDVRGQGGVPEQRAGGEESDDDRYRRVFRSFIADGAGELERDERQLLNQRFRTPGELRAAGVATGGAGGYLVPPEFRDYMLQRAAYFGPMLDLATVIRTDTGANLQWPTNDDVANVGAILAENTQVTEQDLTLGTNSLDSYMYTSKLVRASVQFLQDAANNPEAWLRDRLGERLGRIYNQHFTTGTGTSQPDGIVTSATVGVTGTGSFASTGGVGYVNLVDLLESLDPAYADGPEAGFMGHQTARRALRRLVDTTGRPIWEPSIQAGQPSTLLGYPFRVNNDMPTLAASSKSLLYGSVREAYVIRVVSDVTLLRLTERYADFLQVGFLAFQRADGTLQNGNAVRVFQTTATA